MSEAIAALIGAGGCVAASPYLARLTRSVPDRDERRWWRGQPAGGPRVAVCAAVGVVLGALAGLAAGIAPVLPALVVLALLATPLVVIDYEHHRLPTRLVRPAALAGAVLLVVAAAAGDDWDRALRAAEAAAVVFALLWTVSRVAPFGAGDVRLGGVLAGYLGWFSWLDVYAGLLAGFVLGSLVGVTLIAAGRAGAKTPIPFGPMLVLGALGVLAFGLVPSI